MSTLAASVARVMRRMGLASPESAESYQRTSGADYGPAMIASQSPLPDGNAPTPDLSVRAHRIHNRNARAARMYLDKHLILAKGACFDAD